MGYGEVLGDIGGVYDIEIDDNGNIYAAVFGDSL